MPNYQSSKGKIMLALQTIVKALAPDDLNDLEIEVRDSFQSSGGGLFRGVSILDMGEQLADGTNGTTDVGYICGIMFVTSSTGDAIMPDDIMPYWYETVRRRLVDQRIPVAQYGLTAPKEHVCRVLPGATITNAKKWPQYAVRQLVVAVWVRENQETYV